MKIITVISKASVLEFLHFPKLLFAKDTNYICPLDQDIENVFDPKKNKFYKSGECERFLFKNEQNETVGKIAVFINKKYKQEQPTGGIGFFDCIDDQKTANFIFDFAKDWLQAKGMEAMDGPINFGERDKFWGLLIEGFSEPLYAMNYNPPYYKKSPKSDAEYAWYCGENGEYFQKLFSSLKQYIHSQSLVLMILSEDCDILMITKLALYNHLDIRIVRERKIVWEKNNIYQIIPEHFVIEKSYESAKKQL